MAETKGKRASLEEQFKTKSCYLATLNLVLEDTLERIAILKGEIKAVEDNLNRLDWEEAMLDLEKGNHD